MFRNNLNLELKILLRSKWLHVLFISITLLFLFAVFNGTKNVEKRLNDISKVKEDMQQKDELMLETLKKIENGEETNLPYWKLPTEPMTIGNDYSRLAVMEPETLSFIATGQSDMFTHFKSPKVYGNNFALDYSEMVNPVQLLFGNFDLSFVIIYILPLLIIAFTFNILTKEKELGTLRLMGSQPISLVKWLLQKTAIRFLIFTIITLIILLGSLFIATPNAFNDLENILALIVLLSAYNSFWFIAACIVNIKMNDSSKNALTLVGIWLLLVLVLPATINQIGNTLYPTPSRLKMINEIRLIKKENEEKQNEIMDSYLRDHPELALEGGNEQFGFWHNYFASEKVMEEKIQPLLAEYDAQLKKQQNLINMFKFTSPAILMQQSMNNVAGTSENHYKDFKKQVFDFSLEWKNYLVPMLFKQEKFSAQNYQALPQFNYENRIPNNIWKHIAVVLLMSFIAFIVFIRKSLTDKSTKSISGIDH